MANNPRLAGKVCLVTGATRGIGRGIALQLAESGATVYITGRTLKKTGGLVGSLEETAKEIEERGGRCIPVQCDHSKDDDVQRLFDRIKSEQSGQLDVLVNNAYSGVSVIIKYLGVPFWEQPAGMWDDINVVGLRNHYVCATHAARLMTPRRSGLIVNISSPGGLQYLLNIPYGIGKEACDRMAADGALELRKHNVAFVSLWPAGVSTEFMSADCSSKSSNVGATQGRHIQDIFDEKHGAETVEYAGKAVVFMAADPNIMKKSGRIIYTGDVACEFGFVDVNGRTPMHMRTVSAAMVLSGYVGLSKFVPSWMKIPGWLLAISSHKF